MDVVECSSGNGLKLSVDRDLYFAKPNGPDRYLGAQREITGIFAAAQATNRLKNLDYLRQLAGAAEIDVAPSQASSVSEATACGCALYYPETPLDWAAN